MKLNFLKIKKLRFKNSEVDQVLIINYYCCTLKKITFSYNYNKCNKTVEIFSLVITIIIIITLLLRALSLTCSE